MRILGPREGNVLSQGQLFEPGQYLDKRGPGYFSILAKPNDNARQDSYELRHLPTVIDGLNPAFDTWITQASFIRPNRRAVNVDTIGLLFVDLDTYHVPNLATRSAEQQANMLCGYCNSEGIPTPSIILFSGRGLQAKWLLSEALSAANLYEWNSAQLGLVRRLNQFGSDRNARDVSRVLRVERTTNTKSGERCRVVFVASGVEAAPARYDFEDLHELLADPEPVRARPAHSSGNVRQIPDSMNLQRLNWFRLYDLRDLWKLRGGVPVGMREITLFWELNFLLRAAPGKVCDLWNESQALAAEIDRSPGWYQLSDLGTVYRKAQATAHGARVYFQGRLYTPLYSPRNTTLAEIFQITADEEREMRTIISKDEKVRRRREKRHKQGVRPQEQSLERTKPWEAEGISRRTWYRRRAKVAQL